MSQKAWCAVAYVCMALGFGFGYWCAKHPLRIAK